MLLFLSATVRKKGLSLKQRVLFQTLIAPKFDVLDFEKLWELI